MRFLRRKLPRASFVLLSISLVCAVSAGLTMQAYAHRLDVLRPDGGAPTSVVAVARPVARGTVLGADALVAVTVPERFVPSGAMRDPARVAGRVAVTDLAEGEIVTSLRLAGGGAGRIASLVPPGMRAVELPVASTAGVEPGDRVDVLATFGGAGTHTEVTAEGLEVVSARRSGTASLSGGASPPAAALIVLVPADQVERLAFAAAFATVSVAVLGTDDAALAA
jgi:pilus assembly protein CpaB